MPNPAIQPQINKETTEDIRDEDEINYDELQYLNHIQNILRNGMIFFSFLNDFTWNFIGIFVRLP